MLQEKIRRRREEAQDLVNIIKESDKSRMPQKDINFLVGIIWKLKSKFSLVSEKEIFFLRDIKDRLL